MQDKNSLSSLSQILVITKPKQETPLKVFTKMNPLYTEPLNVSQK
jgi:hypothetical protein